MELTPKYELIQDRLGRPLDQTLREYHAARLSAPAIARLLAEQTRVKVTPETIRVWVRATEAA